MNLEETVRILHELAMQTPQGRAAFTQRKTSVPPEPQPHLGGGETVEETAEKFLRQQIEQRLVARARIASLAARADLTRFVAAYEAMRRRFGDEYEGRFEECDRLVELFLANKLLSEESPSPYAGQGPDVPLRVWGTWGWGAHHHYR